jgi:hypothetical protein
MAVIIAITGAYVVCAELLKRLVFRGAAQVSPRGRPPAQVLRASAARAA